MSKKDYLGLVRNLLKPDRVVCGANYDVYGRAIVTTGIPKQYKEGEITFINQRTTSYDRYMFDKGVSGKARVRRRTYGCIEKNYK